MVELKGIHNKPTKKPQILHNLNQALSILRNKKGFKSSHLFETIEIQEGNEKSIIGLLTDISKNYRNHFLTLQPKKKIKRSVSTNKRPSSARKGRDSRQRSSGVFRRGSIGSIQQRKNVDVSSSLRIGKSDSFLEWLQSIGFNKANPRIFHNPSPNVLRDPLRNGSFLRDLLLFLEPQPKQPNYFWKKNSIPRVVTGADQRVKVSLNFLQSKSHRFNSISSRQIVDGNRGVYYTIQQVYKSTIQPKKYSKQQQVTKKKKKKAKKQKNVDLRSRSFLAGLKESKDFAERQQHLAKMKRQLAVERKLLNWMERIGVLDDGQFLLPPKKNDKRQATLLSRNYRRMREGLTPKSRRKMMMMNNRRRRGGIEGLKDLDESLKDGRILCRIGTIFKRRVEGVQAGEIYHQSARGLEHISLSNINRAFAYFRGPACRGMNRRYLFKDRAVFKGNRKVTVGILLDLAKFDRDQRKSMKGSEFETYMFGDEKHKSDDPNFNDIFLDFDDDDFKGKSKKKKKKKKGKSRSRNMVTPKKPQLQKPKPKRKSGGGVNLSKLIELSVFEDEDDLNRSIGRVTEVSRRSKIFEDDDGLKKSRFIGFENWLLRLGVVSEKRKGSFTLDKDPLLIFRNGLMLYRIVKVLEKRRGESILSKIKGGKIDFKPKKKANCLFNIRKVLNVLKENRDMDLANLWSEEEIFEGKLSTIINLLRDIKRAYRSKKGQI